MLTINDVTSLSSRLACVLGLLVLSIVGCSDVDGGVGPGGTGGAGATGGTAGIGGAVGDGGSGGSGPVSILLEITGPDSVTERGPALVGVEVCETDTTHCETTNADGRAVLELPSNQVSSYTLSKEGYMTRLHAVVTDETFTNEPFTFFPLFRDQIMEDLANDLQIPYPFEGGLVTLQATPFGTAGVTHELLSETATAYYIDEGGIPTLGLTETTSSGQGGFLEVTAGEHQVEFGGTVTNCTARIGWPGDAANRVKFPVRVGHMTFARAVCEGSR